MVSRIYNIIHKSFSNNKCIAFFRGFAQTAYDLNSSLLSKLLSETTTYDNEENETTTNSKYKFFIYLRLYFSIVEIYLTLKYEFLYYRSLFFDQIVLTLMNGRTVPDILVTTTKLAVGVQMAKYFLNSEKAIYITIPKTIAAFVANANAKVNTIYVILHLNHIFFYFI